MPGADGSLRKFRTKAGTNLKQEAGTDATVKCGSKLLLEAGATADLKAGSQLKLKGAFLKVNDGTSMVARQNDPVAGNNILVGSPTFMA